MATRYHRAMLARGAVLSALVVAFGCHGRHDQRRVDAPPATARDAAPKAPQAPEAKACTMQLIPTRLVRWSPNGRSLLAACDDGPETCDHRVDLIPFAAGEVPHALDAALPRLSFWFSPDGARLAAIADPTTGAGVVSLWETATWSRLARHDTYNVSELVYSADSSRLVVAGGEGQLDVLDARSGRVLASRPVSANRAASGNYVHAAFVGATHRFVFVDYVSSNLLDGDTLRGLGALAKLAPRPPGAEALMAVDVRGTTAVFQVAADVIEVWDGTPLARRFAVTIPPTDGYRILQSPVISPDGHTAAMVDSDGAIVFVDLDHKTIVVGPSAARATVSEPRWLSNDDIVVQRSVDQDHAAAVETVEVWRRDAAVPRWVGPGFAYDADAKRLVVLDAAAFRVFSIADMHVLSTHIATGISADHIALSPDGEFVAYAGQGPHRHPRVVRLRDGRTLSIHRYAATADLANAEVHVAVMADRAFDGDEEAARCAAGPDMARTPGLAAAFAAGQ